MIFYVGSFFFLFFKFYSSDTEISLFEALSFAGQSVNFFLLLLVVLYFVFRVVLIDHFLRQFCNTLSDVSRLARLGGGGLVVVEVAVVGSEGGMVVVLDGDFLIFMLKSKLHAMVISGQSTSHTTTNEV